MNKISSDDRSSLIRLASALPAGDESRRAILAGLKLVAADDKVKVPAHLSPFLGKHKKLFESFLAGASLSEKDLADEGSAKDEGYGKWHGQLPRALEEFGAEHPEEADEAMVAWASKKTGIPKKKLIDPNAFLNGGRGFEIRVGPSQKT